MTAPYGIHWFRRDLRLTGNPGLEWNLSRTHGRTLGIFVFDQVFLAREDISEARFALFLKTLRIVREGMRAGGGDLICLDVGPDRAFRALIKSLQAARKPLPAFWSYCRDYEPFAVERDQRIGKLLRDEFGIETHSERDHLLIEPRELIQHAERERAYAVYTPFSRQWLDLSRGEIVQDRLRAVSAGWRGEGPRFSLKWKDLLPATQAKDCLDDYLEPLLKKIRITLPEAGPEAALAHLEAFRGARLRKYKTARDLPATIGTSQMSIYLKNGSITVPQIIARLKLHAPENPRDPSGETTYLKELIWREFYYHILAFHPSIETHAFQARYETLKWSENDSHLDAWKQGLTGYPIVDAGMRQLNETGWMHNRVRMIVASFLTKDLQISYRHGENYFMKQLLDGDLAPNNGGWQWAASTGCDAQPWFRIFNPELQSRKFDAEGEYIRKWVPELRALSAREIHAPPKTRGYPAPIVVHAEARAKTLALFKQATQAPASRNA